MIIMAPISVGELFDKITILQVKKERLTDTEKLANVAHELANLQSIADEKIVPEDGMVRLIDELRRINGELWDIEDGKRAAEDRGTFDAAFVRLARDVYLKNDRRAAIKRSINVRSGSAIVEEKSHRNASVRD